MTLPPELAAALAAAAPRLGIFAGRVSYFSTVASTNDVAAALAAEGAPEGTTVVAGAQTAGRGRYGRAWYSPEGAGLYMSCVFRPAEGSNGQTGSAASLLTLAAAVAVADAVRAFGVPAEIKWPNDLIVRAPTGWRKLAGILAEANVSGATLEHVIVGIGINRSHASCPPDIADRVGCVEEFSGRQVSSPDLLCAALAEAARVHEHLAAGRAEAILDRWRDLAPSACGVAVEWRNGAAMHRGVTAGLDRDGALLVEEGGICHRFYSGELVWRL
ncbi:MAG: biotin--[acetyl-CoA-carboxylase] ligase [Acidobacteria bacterium]|nr:biotin--[acetyl-CoA-carboxylase] ligase [Acidobacteriota bacterium]